MKSTSLRKRALGVFLISSLVFILLTGIASRLYIRVMKDNFVAQQENNYAFIGSEFSKIIQFYAETDPEKLITSDLLQLYSHLEEQTHMAILNNNTVIFGQDFYDIYVTDSDFRSIVEIKKYNVSDGKGTVITLLQLDPSNFNVESPNPQPFNRVNQFATTAFFVYMIFLIFAFMYFINRILKPLEDVKRAANEIKNGNLDYEIIYKNHDEIGEVFDAIEGMRKELRITTELRSQYETNRNELLSNITHDLKTPITSIKGYTEGIRDGVADSPEKVNRYANIIYKHAEDMDLLINDLFLMSKLDIDQIDFQFEPLNLNEFLSDCYEDFYFDLSAKDVLFNFESQVSPVYITGDRQNLKRVMVNLIQNSVNHLDKELNTIELILEANKSCAIIRLRDNGMGIPVDKLEVIFERFYRVDDSRNSNIGGSGIGLSIVKKIIEKHQGSIKAYSTLHQCTEMVIELPLLFEEDVQ